jgi:hypothetical protein
VLSPIEPILFQLRPSKPIAQPPNFRSQLLRVLSDDPLAFSIDLSRVMVLEILHPLLPLRDYVGGNRRW